MVSLILNNKTTSILPGMQRSADALWASVMRTTLTNGCFFVGGHRAQGDFESLSGDGAYKPNTKQDDNSEVIT